jgi:hypothetical protein
VASNLAEADWPLVLVSTKQSKINSSIPRAIDNLSYSRSFLDLFLKKLQLKISRTAHPSSPVILGLIT